MPNPTITAYATPTTQYTVGASDVAYYDVKLSDLNTGGDVTITAPAGSEVHAWTLAGAEATVRWRPNGVEQALLTGGAWVASANVGSLTLAVSSGAAATDPAIVTVTSLSAATAPLRIRVRNIGAGTAKLQAGANAGTQRIVADPSIASAGPVSPPVVERATATLAGTASVSFQEGVPDGAFGLHPTVLGEWTRTTSKFAFALTPVPPVSATFPAPGVYQDETESFQFRAYYDLDLNGAFTATVDPDNTLAVDVTIKPVKHRMVLVLDRSGSMAAALPGGSESKWDATVRAAHAWVDLFSALRASSGQTAGFLTFEASNCQYDPCAVAPDVTPRNPATGAPTAALAALSSFAGVNTLNLGAPGTCTPIGDALTAAFNALTPASLGAEDLCTIVLLTDGHENAGCTTFRGSSPPGHAGVATVKGKLDALPVLKDKLSLYAIGLGAGVDESDLNALPGLPTTPLGTAGYYNLTTDTSALLGHFAQMMGHSVDSQDLGATIGPGNAAFFTTSAGEHRLVTILGWNNTPTHTLQLSHRAQGSADPYAVLPGIPTTQRKNHGMLVVDLAAALGPGAPAADWKLERMSGGIAQPLDNGVLAMIDLHLKVSVSFDKEVYATGEPMHVSATILAGKDPVTGATVVAEPDTPAEGLGTYMAQHGSQLGGPVTIAQLGDSKLSGAFQHRGPDQPPPKAALFGYYLGLDKLDGLPRVPGIFTDGTNNLFDDGAHGDGDADDGVYANMFGGTMKEGTYTFRFRAEGTLPDGSAFRRVITVSTWVGVSTDPMLSPVSISNMSSPPAGMVGRVIAITPRDARGEYLGPFREDMVVITASAGSFSGPVESRVDGSYVRTLLYKHGEDPVITVTVGGVPVSVRPAKPESCWSLFVSWIRCLLHKIGIG